MHKNQTVRLITFTALLVALGVVLDRLSMLSPALKVGFGFVPVVVAAVLYGPIVSAIVYGLSDLVAALVLPFGPYFPGFTLCAALMGAVYGIFLHKKNEESAFPLETGIKWKKITFWKNILPPTVINSLIGLFINTIWVSMLYDSKTYWGFFVTRIFQYAVLIPLNFVLIPVLMGLCGKISKVTFGGSR